jgi:ABC-type transporter Mla MlaB component
MFETDLISPTTLRLRGRATIDHTGAMYRALEAMLPVPEPVVLELDGLEELDTAGLQLLLAFVLERGRDHVDLRGWTPLQRSRLQLAGMTEILG